MLPSLKKSRFTFKELQVYVAIVLKHLRLMILLMCMSLLLGLAFYLFKRPVYHCKSLVRVENKPRILDEESFFHDTSFEYLMREANGAAMLERIGAVLGLEFQDYQDIKKRHLKKISSRRSPKYEPGFTYYEVRVWAYSYDIADRWLPVAMREFYKYRAERRENVRRQRMSLWSEEMARMRTEMEKFAQKEERFKEQTDYVQLVEAYKEVQGVPSALAAVEQRLQTLDKRATLVNDEKLSLVEQLALISRLEPRQDINVGDIISPESSHTFELAEEELSENENAEITRSDADENGRENRQIVVVPQMIKGKSGYGWVNAELRLRQLLKQKKAMAEIYLPGHPKMQAVQSQVDQLTERLRLQINAWNERLNWERAQLLDRKRQLEERMPEVGEVVQRYQKVASDLKMLKYGELPWQKHHDDMQKQLAMLKVNYEYGAEAPERTQVEYLGPTQENKLPVSPNRLKLLLASLALGGILCLAIPFSIEYFDHTITMLESAEENLGIRGLGIVPLIPEGTSHRKRFIMTDPTVDDAYQRSFIETFRMIRANMQIASAPAATARKILMITSSLPREGKTMVSANLAVTFARMGRKVLLIDADTRRGSLHHTFGVNSVFGLSGLLNGDATFDEAKVATAQVNLDLLPTGPHTGNVIELLASPLFAQILDELRNQYDHIFIDTPPALGLSESCELIPYVDGVLLVVWSGYTPRHQVEAAKALLSANGAKFLGFVLNRVDLSKATNYYHYYYYSDYYYHSYHNELPEKSAASEAS